MKILRAILFSNVFIAVCGVCLRIFCEPSISPFKAFFFFSEIVVIYSLLKLAGVYRSESMIHSSQSYWLKTNFLFQVILVCVFFLVFMVCWWKLDFVISINWVIALVFLCVYVLFRLVKGQYPAFHFAQSFFKIATVAVVWAVLLTNAEAEHFDIFKFLFVFLFLLALMLPFEIKDMKYDAPYGVTTLPFLLGIRRSKQAAALLLVLAVFAVVMSNFGIAQTIAAMLTAGTGVVVISFSDEHKEDIFYLLFVDGLMILPLFFLMIVRVFIT